MHRSLIVASLLALAACTGSVVDENEESTQSNLEGGIRIETHFTDPTKYDKGHDPRILDDLIRLIDGTDKGDTIDAAIHSIASNEVVKAFDRAKKREVVIRVAHNGENFGSDDSSPRDLANILGKGHRFCGNVESKGGNVGGCIANGASSIMHAKLVLFSHTKDESGAPQSSVTWFGSANMTNATGANTFNNTVTVYGDKTLFQKFTRDYFDELWTQDHAAAGATLFSAASHVTAWASPHESGDLILARLKPIEPNSKCEVRVSQAMLHDSRMALVDRLVELKKGKCLVKVIGSDNGKELDASVAAKLKAAGIPLRRNHIHDKIILVDAKYDGEAARQIVFTGSHNWTKSANDLNDELFVKIEVPSVYAKFKTHFEDTWATAK